MDECLPAKIEFCTSEHKNPDMPGSSLLEQKLHRAWPPEVWRDVTVVVAISGGPDSVALLRGLTSAAGQGDGQLVAAHFNHGLRGEQSQADEAFVVELCGSLGIRCETGRAERGDGEKRRGGEGDAADAEWEAAVASQGQAVRGHDEAGLRAARYQFLCAVARQVGSRYVATGHTADDQAETVLHRFLRGTGIGGLAGMRRCRQLIPGVSLVRPLLSVSRREVLDYLAAIGQSYREDRSNAELRYTRNRIRHELLPHLAGTYNPGVVDAITRLATLADEVQEIVAGLVDDLAARCITVARPGEVTVDGAVLATVPRYLVRELLMATWRRQGWALQSMGFERWEELAELALGSQPPAEVWKKVFPGPICAERAGCTLRLLASSGLGNRRCSG